MRTSNLSNVFKIIIFVIAAIIVCVICGIAIGTTNTGKALVNNSTTQIKNIAGDNGDIKEASLDGNTLLGSEVVALIEDAIETGEQLSVVVSTLAGSRTDYNYIYDNMKNSISTSSSGDGTKTLQASSAQPNYINKDALFLCDVKKSENDKIICLWFEQQ